MSLFATTMATRNQDVCQTLANHRIEGFQPDAADLRNLTAYVLGVATVGDLLQAARDYVAALKKPVALPVVR